MTRPKTARELAVDLFHAWLRRPESEHHAFQNEAEPWMAALLACKEALEMVNSFAVAWEPLTPGDIEEVRAALKSLAALPLMTGEEEK